MVTKIAAALIIIFAPTSAFSFEVDGLKSGMGEEQALEVLSGYGDPQLFDKGTSPERGLKSYIIRSDSGASRQIIFCTGTLVFYGSGMFGDLHKFMRLLDRNTQIYGTPQTFYRMEETQNGPRSTLVFKWLTGYESTELIFWKIGNDETKVNERYAAQNDCAFAL